ncbi:MAG: MliC family protein [Moraxella sp.]|nr:MliC family protein [Moraxella sp.]
MKALFAAGIVALALVGCASSPILPKKPAPQQPPTSHQHNSIKAQTFVCDNGATPTIRALNQDQIEFTSPLGDATPTIMTIAPAASGTLYVSKTGIYGKGGEWHQKGDMAVFTYYDVGSPATCKAK